MGDAVNAAAVAAARLKDARVLIVSNLLNGVPLWQVARDYHLSVAEVEAIFKIAMNKVKNYVFRLCKPPLACDTLDEAKRNRFNLLAILPRLNFDKPAEFASIVSETVTDKNCKSAIHDILR